MQKAKILFSNYHNSYVSKKKNTIVQLSTINYTKKTDTGHSLTIEIIGQSITPTTQ